MFHNIAAIACLLIQSKPELACTKHEHSGLGFFACII